SCCFHATCPPLSTRLTYRRSSDLAHRMTFPRPLPLVLALALAAAAPSAVQAQAGAAPAAATMQGESPSKLVLDNSQRVLSTLERSEEHTSELQSRENIVCRLLLDI